MHHLCPFISLWHPCLPSSAVPSPKHRLRLLLGIPLFKGYWSCAHPRWYPWCSALFNSLVNTRPFPTSLIRPYLVSVSPVTFQSRSEHCGRIHLSTRLTVLFFSSIFYGHSLCFLPERQHCGVVEIMGSRVRMPGFKCWLLLLPVCMTLDELPQCLSFLTWKGKMKKTTIPGFLIVDLIHKKALKVKSPESNTQ